MIANQTEFMFLNVSVRGVHLLVCVCYKAPDIGSIREFEKSLLDLMTGFKHVIVMGDFNTNLLDLSSVNRSNFVSMFNCCNMSILPMQATHHTATAETWLDVAAVGDASLVAHHGQLSVPGISKHDLIFCAYRLHPPKPKQEFITYRNYRYLDMNSLLLDAASIPWYEVVLTANVDEMIEKLNTFLLVLYDTHAPLVTRRVNKKPAPWFGPEIREMQKVRDSVFRRAKRSKSAADWAEYKRLRNKTQQEIRNAKIEIVKHESPFEQIDIEMKNEPSHSSTAIHQIKREKQEDGFVELQLTTNNIKQEPITSEEATTTTQVY
ncbi:uncharacterized protein LOC111048567 [Nilaparvata lugens]|uniref:uncharacterized protein LOC111048567 n=1 Tax=Nilaparvata lugens TaxID=108931 RepID=UPI00193D241B|nr:uncharacterized protein LOC111048567 [Nilaparvata lugens]